ncbi:MAG: hypothetical protein Q7V20_00175 [Aquabacterium sp.]|nr:hypothetical protein [Aquabacterium sp.]
MTSSLLWLELDERHQDRIAVMSQSANKGRTVLIQTVDVSDLTQLNRDGLDAPLDRCA